MLSDDMIVVKDVNDSIDDLRLELIQYYEEEDKDEKIDILEQIIDLCDSYLSL